MSTLIFLAAIAWVPLSLWVCGRDERLMVTDPYRSMVERKN